MSVPVFVRNVYQIQKNYTWFYVIVFIRAAKTAIRLFSAFVCGRHRPDQTRRTMWDLSNVCNMIGYLAYVSLQNIAVDRILKSEAPSTEFRNADKQRTLQKYFGSDEEQLVARLMRRVCKLIGPANDGMEKSPEISRQIVQGCLYVLTFPTLKKALTQEHVYMISRASVYASALLHGNDQKLQGWWEDVNTLV